MPTNEELQEMVDAEKAKNEELTKRLADVEGQTPALKPGAKEGWFIETPEAGYDGEVHNISFTNGQAFIRKDQIVKDFVFSPVKEGTMDQLGYSDAEKEKVREREKISSAERCVECLKSDFGYKVTEVTSETVSEMNERISDRTQQRIELDSQLAAKRNADMMMKPEFMGEGD